MAHIFLSYLHDDKDIIERLVTVLRYEGLDIWLDNDRLQAGTFWEEKIQLAISQADFFLACFSPKYDQRQMTYMEREVRFAIDKKESKHETWLVPIRLMPCEIPILGLNDGRTLRDIQWVDLFPDWNMGIHKLLNIVRPRSAQSKSIDEYFRDFCARHIESKIARDITLEAMRVNNIEERWRSLVRPLLWEPTLTILVGLFEKVQHGNPPLTETYDAPGESGCTIAVTLSRSLDSHEILESLSQETREKSRAISFLPTWHGLRNKKQSEHPYYTFLSYHIQRIWQKTNWYQRDFIHWIFAVDDEEITVDLLYWLNLEMWLVCFGMYLEQQKGQILQSMYPGSLLTSQEMEGIAQKIILEEIPSYPMDDDDSTTSDP